MELMLLPQKSTEEGMSYDTDCNQTKLIGSSKQSTKIRNVKFIKGEYIPNERIVPATQGKLE